MNATLHSDAPAAAPLTTDLPPRRPRRVWIGGAAALALVAATTAGGFALWSPAPAAPTASDTASTTPVTLGSMLAETNVQGKIDYAERTPIAAELDGIVTELPAPGAVIAAGAALYRIDTRPVIVLSGTVPAWRDFAPGMTGGPDVAQLEANLKALGYFAHEPDAHFTWSTVEAIRAWQKALGLERTGTISRSMILFSSHDLRVNTVESRVGAAVTSGTPLFLATSSEHVVTLNLRSADRGLATLGAAVTIMLPTGDAVEGTVAAIGLPVELPKADGSGTTVGIPLRVAVADQAALAELSLSSVTVKFSSVLREGVLTVPVDALVPLSDSAFAVELPAASRDDKRTLLPVTVGAFSAGNVEISGKGIVEGLDVVVPSR